LGLGAPLVGGWASRKGSGYSIVERSQLGAWVEAAMWQRVAKSLSSTARPRFVEGGTPVLGKAKARL
jgi:hypothetical protein